MKPVGGIAAPLDRVSVGGCFHIAADNNRTLGLGVNKFFLQKFRVPTEAAITACGGGFLRGLDLAQDAGGNGSVAWFAHTPGAYNRALGLQRR